MKLVMLIVVLLAATMVQAQSVYKCQGADGRTTYQNTPCTGDASGAAMSSGRLGGNTVAARTPAAPQAESDRAAGSAATGAAGARCYDDGDLREISVRLSSPTASGEERAFLSEEQRRVTSCELAKFSSDERGRRMDAMRDLGSTDRARRDAARNTIRALYEQNRANVRAAAAAERKNAQQQPQPATPAVI